MREQPCDQYGLGAQSDQNDFQVESPHSPFVRLHPTDLFVPHRRSVSARRSIRELSRTVFIRTEKPRTPAQQSFQCVKQIYRQSWESLKMEVALGGEKQKLLSTASRSKFEAGDSAADMRPFFAILCLMLFLIPSTSGRTAGNQRFGSRSATFW